MRRPLPFRLLVAALPLVAAAPASAVNFTAGTYVENFNSLASSGTGTLASLPAGFTVTETGANANTTYTAGTGSGNAGDTYSFGVAGANPVTERALGMIQSGAGGATLLSRIDAVFTNATGAAVTALAIGYTGEQWRLGTTGRADRIDFSYSLNGTTFIDFDALDFSSPVTAGTVGALDGNLAANRTVLSQALSGLSLANGASIYFRWSDFDATGADDGLAIDDFNLTPTLAAAAVPEPASWAMLLLGFGIAGAALRRRRGIATVAA